MKKSTDEIVAQIQRAARERGDMPKSGELPQESKEKNSAVQKTAALASGVFLLVVFIAFYEDMNSDDSAMNFWGATGIVSGIMFIALLAVAGGVRYEKVEKEIKPQRANWAPMAKSSPAKPKKPTDWLVELNVFLAIAGSVPILWPHFQEKWWLVILLTAFVMTMMIIVAAVYLLPSYIARERKHPNFPAICALNLLAGWSGLGWIAAFVWSLTKI